MGVVPTLPIASVQTSSENFWLVPMPGMASPLAAHSVVLYVTTSLWSLRSSSSEGDFRPFSFAASSAVRRSVSTPACRSASPAESEGRTSSSVRVRAGDRDPSLMMWYPNCVLIGPRISPGAIVKAASSNSGTIWPRENGGSWPPLPLPLGSSVFSLASLAKSAPGSLARAATMSAFAFALRLRVGSAFGLQAR